jgi:hypothetical protein
MKRNLNTCWKCQYMVIVFFSNFGERFSKVLFVLFNHIFTNKLERMIPLQAWCKCKPTVTHMKVFKSDVYVHNPKELWSKLDSENKECMCFLDIMLKVKPISFGTKCTIKLWLIRMLSFMKMFKSMYRLWYLITSKLMPYISWKIPSCTLKQHEHYKTYIM